MADTTQVNPQITDAVTKSNVKGGGEIPVVDLGDVFRRKDDPRTTLPAPAKPEPQRS